MRAGFPSPGTTSGLSASLFSLLGEMICPVGLRGHGPDDVIRIRECYSDADVRISPSKVPFFKGISTSPWLYFAYHLHAIAATHIGEHFHLPATLFVFKPLRTRPRAFCTSRLRGSLRADKRPFYIPMLGMEEIIA